MLNRNQREHLRKSYRPKHVTLLFIGESPPASGRFFYQGDSGLYRAMRDLFQRIDPKITDESFLATFRTSGCYLIDLCLDPVDQLDSAPRRAECKASEASLSKMIAKLSPATIVTLVRSIEGNVLNATASTQWSGRMIHVPYPGRWAHLKRQFVDTLVPVIARR